jgi:hypothetical protein
MRVLIVLIFLVLLKATSAQTVIKGEVKDPKGRILAGASISIKNSYDGTVSDSTGKFKFTSFEKGSQLLVISFVGSKTQEIPVDLKGEEIDQTVVLKEEISELKAVVITAGSFEANDKKRGTVLRSLDIATTAGANADISATIQTLPGAQKVGEQEGLFVRGGSAEEARIFIDGSSVNNFFFSSVPGIAQRGRFSPFLFSGTVFSSGGYSALYGQALSSVLALESIDLPEQSEAQAGISPIFLSGGFQQLGKGKKSSYGMSYSFTHLALYQKLVPQAPDFFKAPQFHNIDANFRIKTKRGGMIKAYAYFNAGELALRRPSLDSIGLKNAFSLTNYNVFGNISYRQPLGNGWKLQATGGISYNLDQIGNEVQNQQNQKVPNTGITAIDFAQFNVNQTQRMWQIRSVLEKKLSGINAIRFGGEVWRNTDTVITKFETGKFENRWVDVYTAFFAESDIFLSNEWALRPGLRVERSSILAKANIAPRVSLSYKIAAQSQMSIDYGVFYQTPERRFIANPNDLGFLRADHYIFTYQHLSRDYTFRTQLYYKDYKNLLQTDAAIRQGVSIDGSGYAKGLELFWRDRKTLPGLDYWISYTYLDTKREFQNYPFAVQPPFAATHSGSFVFKKFWVKKMFGVNWSWNWSTGRPYFDPNRPQNEFMSDRTIPFHSHNFSMNWLPKIGKANSVVVVGINNVFNQNQIFSYNFSSRVRGNDGRLISEAVIPPAPRSFFIGLFLSWGVDRTQENINNNL